MQSDTNSINIRGSACQYEKYQYGRLRLPAPYSVGPSQISHLPRTCRCQRSRDWRPLTALLVDAHKRHKNCASHSNEQVLNLSMRTAAAQVCDYASVNGPSSPNNRRERRTLIARRQRRRFRWTKVWLILAGVIALLGIVGQIFAVASPQPVPGWEGLALCSCVASLDGAKSARRILLHHLLRIWRRLRGHGGLILSSAP